MTSFMSRSDRELLSRHRVADIAATSGREVHEHVLICPRCKMTFSTFVPEKKHRKRNSLCARCLNKLKSKSRKRQRNKRRIQP